jgi:hypothetical protein
MHIARTLSILLAGLVAYLTLRNLFGTLEQAKARVQPDPGKLRITRLRQDPRTGIYYPDP